MMQETGFREGFEANFREKYNKKFDSVIEQLHSRTIGSKGNEHRPSIGGEDFGISFATIAEEYRNMLNHRELEPDDYNELEGVVKYLEDADRIIAGAIAAEEQWTDDKDSRRRTPEPLGHQNPDYFEPLSDIRNGIFRIILTSVVEKHNSKVDDEEKYYLKFGQEDAGNKYATLGQMASKIFVCRVSSQAIISTFSKTRTARCVISSRLPMGVATM